MALVLLADDAYMFMVSWETMALSSYFLVTTEHHVPDIRKAGFLYLLIAHVGAIAILLSFGVMQGGHGIGAYTFAAMRDAHLSVFWSSVVFLLALFGFGAKAGLLPLHVWLPEAHPAAPSPVSALMSGLLLVGIGLAIIFHVYGKDALAALSLTATLYHSLNHAFFKSLLFVGTGSILHATGERNMGRMGGLIHHMPWVAALMLVGVLSISGLPPFNGFVSEWLLLQAFLLSPGLPNNYINMLIPVAAAVIALAAALAAYVMVKFYGVIFLGQPRGEAREPAHDAGMFERIGLSWLALVCVVLGLAPVFVVRQLDLVTQVLVGRGVGNAAPGWLFLAPVDIERASYSPVYF